MNKKLSKRILAMILSFAVVFSMIPGVVFADGGSNSISAYVTISDKGTIGRATDGTLMADVPISVEDKDNDGKITVDELMIATHEKYCKDGYSVSETSYGKSVTKLWGSETSNTLFFVNNKGINTGVAVDTVSNGDYVTASVNSDNTNYADWYTYFTNREIEVFQDEEFELQLKGHLGMAFGEKDKTDVSIANANIGMITEAGFQAIDGKNTNSEGKVKLSFAKPGNYYLSASGNVTAEISDWSASPYDGSVKKTVECPIIAPYCKVTVKEYNVNITVPQDAKIYVAEKPNNKHYVPFTKIESSLEKANNDGTKTVSYNLTANKTYNYRVWGEDYITYADKFMSPKANAASVNIAVTENMLKPGGKTSKSIDRALTSNSKYNVADVYLNINEKGHLELNTGETYQIVNLRNWEATDTTTNNYFIEPDYHYAVIDETGKASDVVEIDEQGLLTAKKDGTAIILVTYDSINVNSAVGGPFFGAIWPENTGVFVVTVGSDDTGIITGMKINEGKNSADTSVGKLAGDKLDAEHDVIYYLTELTDAEGKKNTIDNAHGEFTFTPENVTTVEIANPVVLDKLSFNGFKTVAQNKDGSYTVKLVEGRNIVKLSNAKGSEYQVITAKGVTATVNNVTSPGKSLTAGDAFSIKFNTIYHPANKLAGVYNMSAGLLYDNVEGYDNGVTFGGASKQYDFASTEIAQTVSNKVVWGPIGWSYGATTGDKLIVPASYEKTDLKLSGGHIIVAGFGDPYGNHRGITLADGKAPNFNASTKIGYFGKLPDITVEVKKENAAADVESIEVKKQPTKTTYYEGDIFDAAGMEIEVTYADDTKRTIAGGFEYDKTPLNKSTDKISISFGGKTAEISISVQELLLESISIDNPPTKTDYTVGDYFNPSGMVVKAAYNSGKTVEITDYTYSKEALKKGDTEVTINYEGKTATQNITVTDRTVAPSENITVKFSLLGDSKHGDDGQTHTLKAGNLTTWVGQTSVEVDKDAAVIDVIEKVLAMNGIGFKNASGNYISEINGLGEFDNGEKSGWMYTLNGVAPLLGVAEQTLKNGDVIVLYYTDDYTKEAGSEKWGTPEETKKEVTTSGTDTKTTTSPTDVKVSASTATATVTDENAAELVKQAKENKSAEIILNVSSADTDNAETVNLELTKKTLDSIVNDTDAAVTVKTQTGEINLDKETLKQINSEAAGDVITIEITRISKPEETHKTLIGADGQIYRLTVKSGDSVISQFKGNVTVRLAIPAALKDRAIAAVHIKDGALEKLDGRRITQDKVEFYEFKTPHFSEFALVDTDQVKLEADDTDNADKAKSLVKELKLTAASSKTSKKNVKITVKMNSKNNALIKELKGMGYTVKYKYYRSTKKASKYSAVKTKTAKTYINTKGKKGSRYYYKARVMVYDGDKLVAQSALKQCRYAARVWSK